MVRRLPWRGEIIQALIPTKVGTRPRVHQNYDAEFRRGVVEEGLALLHDDGRKLGHCHLPSGFLRNQSTGNTRRTGPPWWTTSILGAIHGLTQAQIVVVVRTLLEGVEAERATECVGYSFVPDVSITPTSGGSLAANDANFTAFLGCWVTAHGYVHKRSLRFFVCVG